jgi:hypothetical protein
MWPPRVFVDVIQRDVAISALYVLIGQRAERGERTAVAKPDMPPVAYPAGAS